MATFIVRTMKRVLFREARQYSKCFTATLILHVPKHMSCHPAASVTPALSVNDVVLHACPKRAASTDCTHMLRED